MGFKPFIAIGHGVTTENKWDPGTVWENNVEADIAKIIVGGILEVFVSNGKDYVTDYPENDMNIIECVESANKRGCTHYVSIHLDWEKAESGMFALYVSDAGAALGADIRNAVTSRMDYIDKGNRYQDDYEVTGTLMEATIFEAGSIDDDGQFLKDNGRFFGNCIAYGIMDRAGENYKELDGSVVVAPSKPENKPESSGKIEEDGKWGSDTTSKAQNKFGTPVDGVISGQLESCREYICEDYGTFEWDNGDGSPFISALQRLIGANDDGWFGFESAVKLQTFLKVPADGYIGPVSVLAFQKWLNS
ncbi:MAG: N-acetylmuramoyl-L-alanine amidase [Eubacterium aggregans]|uniref:N-acetylmuramoyl-L-alanine amidase n=1 Tax=Eubacterium aggregans TaxID=81409 RepID=A0A1H3YYU0_9FIRM|nr:MULTISPECIES: N-acetylmuramoyl-L-alanine amidase [Clostridia]MEA5003641.1 N-acetylmuramoyl-L-alanine amidase [Christensenella sp.]MEA5073679.1 N-acetylmuramoyl-L-alanine amidase [Eubacterium aggregans]SEA16321.1 N-acetylmuramoyl-L-alanine amidase [Eubacterium aggregans]